MSYILLYTVPACTPAVYCDRDWRHVDDPFNWIPTVFDDEIKAEKQLAHERQAYFAATGVFSVITTSEYATLKALVNL